MIIHWLNNSKYLYQFAWWLINTKKIIILKSYQITGPCGSSNDVSYVSLNLPYHDTSLTDMTIFWITILFYKNVRNLVKIQIFESVLITQYFIRVHIRIFYLMMFRNLGFYRFFGGVCNESLQLTPLLITGKIIDDLR